MWYNKDTYGYFTTMSLNEIAYSNHAPMRKYKLKEPRVGVLCKQPYYAKHSKTMTITTTMTSTKTQPTTTAIEKPLVTTRQQPLQTKPFTAKPDLLGEDCRIPDRDKYKKTREYRGQLCYFIVGEANEKSNNKEGSVGIFNININTARDICIKNNGTLLSIYSSEEANFVLNNFQSADFKIGFFTPAGIALDMNIVIAEVRFYTCSIAQIYVCVQK